MRVVAASKNHKIAQKNAEADDRGKSSFVINFDVFNFCLNCVSAEHGNVAAYEDVKNDQR